MTDKTSLEPSCAPSLRRRHLLARGGGAMAAVGLSTFKGAASAQAKPLPACVALKNPDVDPSDLALIEEVLDAYTSSVSSGDRGRFEKLLLDPDIPFFGLDDNRMPSEGAASLRSVQQFAGFRKAVFESGQKYTQRFFNVKVECDGDLAQVSLNFETRLLGTDEGARGWKILHMLRVNGQWKIASEFYTAFDLNPKNR